MLRNMVLNKVHWHGLNQDVEKLKLELKQEVEIDLQKVTYLRPLSQPRSTVTAAGPRAQPALAPALARVSEVLSCVCVCA